MATKRILTRLEEQMATQHETQLDQMFEMQMNNQALQAQMNKLEAENEYLKTCMDDQSSPSFVHKQDSNVQIERDQSSNTSASKVRETFGIKPNLMNKSRKTTHMQPPTKKI